MNDVLMATPSVEVLAKTFTGKLLRSTDAAFDEAEAEIKSAEKALKAYLKEVCTKLEAGNDITYISLQKESHLLEIPQVMPDGAP